MPTSWRVWSGGGRVMSMLRKIEDEREARACLRAARAAGAGLAEWARERGIDGRSLNAWRMNLARSRAGGRGASLAAPPRLVELVAAPPTGPRGRYVVRVAGAEIELAEDFREETLGRIVRVLRSC
jgi:hypothetical protein